MSRQPRELSRAWFEAEGLDPDRFFLPGSDQFRTPLNDVTYARRHNIRPRCPRHRNWAKEACPHCTRGTDDG